MSFIANKIVDGIIDIIADQIVTDWVVSKVFGDLIEILSKSISA